MTDQPALPFPLGHGSITLRTRRGRQVQVRHITPEDDVLLIELYDRLSPETRRFRFFAYGPDLPDMRVWREAMRLAHIDPRLQAALIATVEEDGLDQAVGVARLACESEGSDCAELAIALRDDYQREGLGTLLLDLIVQVAMVRGHKCLQAVSLAENVALQRLIDNLGLPVRAKTQRGETTQIILLDGEP